MIYASKKKLIHVFFCFVFCSAGHINQRIDEVSRELETGSPQEQVEHVDFIQYVIGTEQLSRQEILDNIIEIFMGGIDTVSLVYMVR
jgi:hypothetical protein